MKLLRNKTKGPYKIFTAYERPVNSQKAKLARRYILREDYVPIRLVAKQTKMAERVTLVNKYI